MPHLTECNETSSRKIAFIFIPRDESPEMGASHVCVRNTSSYTAGPPPRGRKIHPFFRRSIPGRPTLPPPSLSAPVRSTPVAVSSFLRRTLVRGDQASPACTPCLPRKVSLLRRFPPRWRCASSFRPSRSRPLHVVHIRELPFSLSFRPMVFCWYIFFPISLFLCCFLSEPGRS